jgi:two-component system nitrate/nitrite response regulator NarL
MTKRPRALVAYHHSDCSVRIDQQLSTGFNIVGIIHQARRFIRAALNLRPDVALIDVSLPLHDGFSSTKQIRSLLPDTMIVFHSLCTQELFARHCPAIGAGLATDSKQLERIAALVALALNRDIRAARAAHDCAAIRALDVGRGSSQNLTERECEVLALLAGGFRMKEIAYRLGITYRTVTFHKYQVMKKLGTRSDAALVRVALHRNVVDNAATVAIPSTG